MKIYLSKGRGTGKTTLSAFDAALWDAGVANYNLIKLSSVIPPNTEICNEKFPYNDENYGSKLYVVISEGYAEKAGEQAWSGLGWVHHNDGSGKGLFVEHSGDSEQEVNESITNSLNSMAVYRPEERGEIFYETCGETCKGDPVCTVVVAAYKCEGWN